MKKKKYTEKQVRTAVQKSKSKSDVCRTLSLPVNGTGLKQVSDWINKYNIDTTHFDGGKSKKVKWEIVKKECPICGKVFITQEGHPKEKTVCSHSCSNTYFRSEQNNGNYKDGRKNLHRKICFKHFEQKCVICGWDKCVDVHHIDGNHNNNHYLNLIPLCPNHHALTRMVKYRSSINKQITKIMSSVQDSG